MNRKILRDCLRIAQDKNAKHPEKWRHFSFIVTDKIVEWATNRTADPLMQHGFPEYGKLHAETEAYRRARGILGGHVFSCVNIRLNRQGVVRCSCPCSNCSYFLQVAGCTAVHFTTDAGFALLNLAS